MYKTLKPMLEQELAEIEKAGLYKRERIITTPQGAVIEVQGGRQVINFCANNYLGLFRPKHPASDLPPVVLDECALQS
jgi:glycine C-acetyltransferase